MTAPAPAPTDLAPSQLGAVLELVAEGLGVDVTSASALRAAQHAVGSEQDRGLALVDACRTLGLSAEVRAGSASIAPSGVTVLAEDDGSWTVVRRDRRGRPRAVRLGAGGEARAVRLSKGRGALPAALCAHVTPRWPLDPIAPARAPELAGRPWLRLWRFLAIERRDLWAVFVYALVVGGLTLAVPVATQALVNTVAFGAWLQPLVVLTVLLAGVLVLSATLTVLEAYVVEVLQRRVLVRVADDFGRRLPVVSAHARDRIDLAERSHRFFDTLTVQKSLSTLLVDGLTVTLQTAAGMILLAFYHPLLLAFDAVLVALLVWVHLLGRGAVATAHAESVAKYRLAAWLEDLAAAPAVFSGATARARAAAWTAGLSRDYLLARRAHFRILLRQLVGGTGLYALSTVALLGFGGWLVLERQLTLGQLVAAELVVTAMGAGFMKLGKNLEMVYDLNVAVLKIGEVVDLPLEASGAEPPTGSRRSALTLRGVELTRGTWRARLPDLELPHGGRLQVVAAAGTGGTTALQTLAGQRPAAEGTLRILDMDVRHADLERLRDRVVFVPQTPNFVATSLEANLGWRLPEPPSPEDLRRALDLLGLEETVAALPQGLATPLHRDGAPLSARQARRLALAGALLARPHLLVLDHALDDLGLPEAARERLLEAVLGAGAPWTIALATCDPLVAARCTHVLQIGRPDREAA